MDCIILRMSGGLGNQMFQYALYLQLKALGRDVSIDDETEYTTVCDDGTVRDRRPKMLEKCFGIRYERADKEKLTAITDSGMKLTDRVRRKLTGRKSHQKNDTDFVFDRTFLTDTSGYFCGCFQSERYFAKVLDEVRAAYTFRQEALLECSFTGQYEKLIRDGNTHAAVHLRFGDYLDNPGKYGNICTDEYYDSAIVYLRSRYQGIKFCVFSNDEALAKEWIGKRQGQEDFVLVSGGDEDHGYADMYLMSLCDHFIIANSSFSWWGAWLGEGEDKTVIAPSFWVRESDGSELGKRDIYTDNMVLISPKGTVVGEADLAGKKVGIEAGPLISVITACYNIEGYVQRAVRSLLEQTYKNIEIIAVDDGSTDSTGKILDLLAKEDDRIKVIHKTNGGLSDARNAGLLQARGEYIGFLDGDDYASPLMYETMVRACLISDAPLACVKYRTFSDLDNDKDRQFPGSSVYDCMLKGKVFSGKKALDIYVSTGLKDSDTPVIIFNSVWSKLFRKDIIEGCSFPKGKNSEDIMWTTRALCKADRVAYIPEKFYNYLEDRKGSIMNVSLGERRLNDEIPFWEEHIEYLKDHGFKDEADKAEYYFYRRLLFYDTDFRKQENLMPYADRLEKLMQGRSDRIKTVMNEASYASSGDKKRMDLFLKDPGRYMKVSRLYEKTVVAAKNFRK